MKDKVAYKKWRAARIDFSVGNDDKYVFFKNKRLKLKLVMEPEEAVALANHLRANAQEVQVARQAAKLAKHKKVKDTSSKKLKKKKKLKKS